MISRALRRLPLTLKLLLLTFAAGVLAWRVMDELQTRELRAVLHEQVANRLADEAREDRLLFDRHRRVYFQTVKVFASHGPLIEHLERAAGHWSSRFSRYSRLVIYRERPDWLPRQSVTRAFAPARFWLLLDVQGRPREIYQLGRDPPPAGLTEPEGLLSTLSYSRVMMTEIGGAAYLLATEPVRGAAGKDLGYLTLGTPVDDDFLAASQSTRGAEHPVVLLSEDGKTVIASSRPEQVPAGSSVAALKERYFMMGRSFFDYGTSELRTWLASLMPASEVEALSARLLWTDRRNRAITSAAIILAFAALMSWVSRRVNRVASQLSEFSKTTLGAPPHESSPGDSIHRLQQEFHFLSRAVVEARIALEKDIAERKKMEAKLLFADRMAAIGTLAAGVAHEINNPLTYVIANLELARTQLDQGGERLETVAGKVDKALEGAERVQVIVRDLRTFARADEDDLGPVDVCKVLRTTMSMASNEIRHRAKLVCEVMPVPPVRANEGRLAQVFLNLLVNAAQAMPEGKLGEGEIRVRSRAEPGGLVAIEIEDTGEGIAPEHLGRIFDPFFTTKPVGVGTGLGLSISRNIVTGLGGTIEARSELGKGTCFKLLFPACAEPVLQAEERAAPVQAPPGRARILVVDDEPDVGEVLELALESDHDVISLREGSSALARFSAGERFDLVFCDLMMPGISGKDLFEELSRIAPDQAERMVFITAGAFTAWSREFLSKVPNPCLQKPFRLENLQAVVAERLAHFAGAGAGGAAAATT